MLQNVAHTHWVSSDVVDLVNRATIRVSFDFAEAPATTSSAQIFALNKGNGQKQALPLTQMEGDQRYLDVTLDPGDVILLWYDTDS